MVRSNVSRFRSSLGRGLRSSEAAASPRHRASSEGMAAAAAAEAEAEAAAALLDDGNEYAAGDVDSPHEQLRNVQSIIALTRENLNAMRAKFAEFEQPPPMYVCEHQELSAKLMELEEAERKLVRVVRSADADFEHPEPPKRVFLRAHLPNKQRTGVQVKGGVTLRDALCKALKLRNLTPDMCEVVLSHSGTAVSWDVDITLIDAEEVSPRSDVRTFYSLLLIRCRFTDHRPNFRQITDNVSHIASVHEEDLFYSGVLRMLSEVALPRFLLQPV